MLLGLRRVEFVGHPGRQRGAPPASRSVMLAASANPGPGEAWALLVNPGRVSRCSGRGLFPYRAWFTVSGMLCSGRFLATASVVVVLLMWGGSASAAFPPASWNDSVSIRLNGLDGNQHVQRIVGVGTPATTFYAATEGNGVFKSTDQGVDWSTFSGGLDNPRRRTTSRSSAQAPTSSSVRSSACSSPTAWALGRRFAQEPDSPPNLTRRSRRSSRSRAVR